MQKRRAGGKGPVRRFCLFGRGAWRNRALAKCMYTRCGHPVHQRGGFPLRILVSGGAGYIGSICSEVLLARGHQVIALDNLQEGHRAAVPPYAVFVQADLAERSEIEKVFSVHKIEAVMHFAGEALVAKSVQEPSTFYAANIACGVNLLDAMVRYGVDKFIFS